MLGIRVALLFTAIFAAGVRLVGYEEPTHLGFTLFLAKMAGYSDDRAFGIAAEDQAIDDDPSTSPMPELVSTDGENRRAGYHFVSAGRIAALRFQAENCRPAGGLPVYTHNVGVYLHALEDLEAHRGFGPYLGHLLLGHAPDKPWYAPGQFVSMAVAKFGWLQQLRVQCGPGPKTPMGSSEFALARAALDHWAATENAAGTQPVPNGEALLRWDALAHALYGAHYSDYTEGSVRRYGSWKAEREANGWRVK